jgi:uncharacterized protein involved in exopolysaccharide biosynthesis
MSIHQTPAGVGFVDYATVLLKWRRLIMTITLLCVVVTALMSLTVPKMYRAEAKILSLQQAGTGSTAQIMNQLGNLGVSSGSVGVKSPNDLYIALMRSTSVLDRIVDRFGLLAEYKYTYREDARRKLVKLMKIQDDKKSGIIVVGVEDSDPQRSAELTNAVIEELKKLTQNIALGEASQRRLFFENQLKQVKEALTHSEESLQGYQEQTGAIEIKEQARAVIESVARLRAQIAAKEVELKVFRSHATRFNPDRQRLEEELSGLKQQLAQLQSGSVGRPDALMPTGKMPRAGAGSVRKVRDLKYNESLFELLAKQYETARIDEAREAVNIQVLDKATPPERKLKQHRLAMVAAAAAGGLFLSILAAFIMEYREIILGDSDFREKLARVWRRA